MARYAVEEAVPGAPRLSVRMRHRIGTLLIDVEFAIREPWTILFGPSGSGKTTILRAIAGLVRPEMARIRMTYLLDTDRGFAADGYLVDTETNRRVTPARFRQIPLASQAASLFPHMTVEENILYGMRSGERSRELERLEGIMSLFQIAHLAEKRPAALSGGEAQLVNLARAAGASRRGGLLLLDEPFTGLDLALRSELMTDLREWAARREVYVVSVTHDVAEAFLLKAEVIQLAEGRVVTQGPVGEVLRAERERLLGSLGG